jgi:hypothetical protein
VMGRVRRRRVGESGAICVSGVLCSGSKGKSRIILGKSRPRGEWGPRKPLKGWTTMSSTPARTCMQANVNVRGSRVKSIHTALSRASTHTGMAVTCALATQVPRWGGRHRASLTCSETADTACDHRLAQSCNRYLSLPTKTPRTSLCYTSLDSCCFGLHA